MAAEDWSCFGDGFPPIRVRMGLHTGRATERDGDYFGEPVNRVARIEAAGNGGQVLLSRETRRLVEAAGLPEGCRLRDLGEHRLKDLRHSERISQVVIDGFPDDARPLRTAGELDARDRIQVLEAHADPDDAAGLVLDRSVPETLDVIEASLRRDSSGAVLTTEQVLAAARHKPADWREWRLGRVAEWSQPRYRLDGRFVGLTLLIDQGEEAVQGRWQAAEERHEDLGDLLAATSDPAIVVLGPPGGGKSTLLRRLELDTAIAGLRGEAGADDRYTFFISLNTYKEPRPGDPPPPPGEWLAEHWSSRSPDLPPLHALLAEGRMTFLLDALNEMPSAGESAFRERVQLWKDWLVRMSSDHPGTRVVFSCRSLDYSQSLSTPDLRVPQVRIEPLTDDQVRDFLMVHSPGRWREIWRVLEDSPQLEVLRSPYFLALLVEQVEATGEMPTGRAALFTSFVRQALRRELERGSAIFASDGLLASRDRRQVSQWRWRGAYDLPERGLLVPMLARLAHVMQAERDDGERSQVRIDLDDALDLLDSDEDEAIVAAGEALAVLDEDEAAGELMFFHQLIQEYFAARTLARELVRVAWRAAEISPSVDEVIDRLDPADPLPPLPGTGWEETTILAATMTEDPPSFLRGVMETNLALAGRAAAQPDLLPLLPPDLLDDLRWGLVPRSRDPVADLRDRIACCYAVGDLGDPRFERRAGPHGGYLVPPLVEIPGGTYPIGDDEPITTPDGAATTHMPRHEVEVARFAIGQFPVTNAEWRCFLEAGGYEDERWWDTDSARAWRRGENTAAGIHAGVREIVARCRKRPEIMDEYLAAGSWDEEIYERGQKRLAMSAEELDAHLIELYPGGRHIEPAFWRDARFNHPSQPVVGIGWYEARAYLSWLSAQSGMVFRLPTEVEWEVAARGVAGRRYAYGDAFDRLRGNTAETRIRQTTPVGVFPGGDTPEGLCDLIGNLFEWTSSAFGRGTDEPEYGYTYVAADGREASETAVELIRVVRGGSWYMGRSNARAAYRDFDRPDGRDYGLGLRVVGWPGRT